MSIYEANVVLRGCSSLRFTSCALHVLRVNLAVLRTLFLAQEHDYRVIRVLFRVFFTLFFTEIFRIFSNSSTHVTTGLI